MEIKVYCMNPGSCKDKRTYFMAGLHGQGMDKKKPRLVQTCTKKAACPLAIPISLPSFSAVKCH